MTLTRTEAADELARLADQLAEADAAYYGEDAPLLSDAEYDALKRRNAALEEAFPDLVRADGASQRVGAAPSSRLLRPCLALWKVSHPFA